ncbi:hypothetical protein I203_108121 [Kwoniella mangroviensis CBS 8507]|uniref:hypothetical protein n=1 Tax=Kwoniella mangroviensis CBS 8507 TaxID=1296122 RepID=UPI00080D642B|nr:uncharacterized protein I203_05015 [Kwoniella mangroviensis CBS 8507]OCF65993.1 hypothetical protein I203_05015 [Kwoniella mangroviensis CBS 8507]
MSSQPVIGFLGYTGLVGSHILPHLLEYHKQGQIKLIILHRKGSDTSKIPDDVEKRSIDLSEGGKEINKKAVEGLQVVLSTVSGEGLESQIYLVDALEGSTTLKSFVHSDFGTNWTAKELKEAPGLSIIGVKEEVVEHAEKKNVPLTHVRVGAFDLFVFKFQAGGTDVKGNVVQVFRDSLKNPLRITSLPFLGQATAQLLLHPDEIANKTYQVYDHEPTGQDFVDALTKLYGSKPEITHYTEEEYQKAIQVPGTSAILAAIKAKWGDDNWGATSPRPEVKGWKSVSFEELTTEWAKQL